MKPSEIVRQWLLGKTQGKIVFGWGPSPTNQVILRFICDWDPEYRRISEKLRSAYGEWATLTPSERKRWMDRAGAARRALRVHEARGQSDEKDVGPIQRTVRRERILQRKFDRSGRRPTELPEDKNFRDRTFSQTAEQFLKRDFSTFDIYLPDERIIFL